MHRPKLLFSILTLPILFQVACKSYDGNKTKIKESDYYPHQITFHAPGQNPEGIEYNPKTNTFYLSAINKDPQIISVDFDGAVQPFSNDKQTTAFASFGLHVDLKNNRLLACENGGKVGNLAIYNLKNGDLEHTINLSSLLPEKESYQINDLVVDALKNIYVTGRLEDAIYKVDANLKPSIFFQKEGFTKPNGIVYHPEGYLLISFSNANSSLVKIPIKNSQAAEIVTIKDFDFKGFDGMVLNEKGNIIAVTFAPDANGNHFVIELSSDDNWKTSNIVNSKKINKSTTIAQVKPNLYYVINQDWQNKKAENWTLEKVVF